MISAKIPADEELRVEALEELEILDTPMEERFERITRMVCRLLNVPMATVSLVAGDRQWFKSVQGLSMRETPRDISFCSHTILQEETFVVEDATRDERFFDNPLVTRGDQVKFYAGRPLHAPDGSKIGALCAIDQKPRTLSADERQTLDDLAAMVESELRAGASLQQQKALANELNAEKRRAMLDPLTGVWNRAGITEMFRRELENARRTGQPLGVVMGDLDHFKKVNDTFGHLAGDDVLRETAKRLVSALRPHDSVGRYGGEEFLMLVPNCEETQVMDVAERARQKISSAVVLTKVGGVMVTVSLGALSEVVNDDALMEELVRKADEALYRAKDMGRDRVELVETARIAEVS